MWFLYDLATNEIVEDPTRIIEIIRCKPETPRLCTVEAKTLADIRGKVEKQIRNTYLKSVQAPVGVKATLKAWMELN